MFARVWVKYGDGWRSDVNDDLLVLDVLRCLLPPYEGPGLTLYRGDSAFNRRRRTYGMSWSASRDVAHDFAQRNRSRYVAGSVLLQVDAPPDSILFAPALHVNDYAEDEYVVDRRRNGASRRFTLNICLPDGWPAPGVVNRGSPRPGPLTAIADR
jgi:hypothetical protein